MNDRLGKILSDQRIAKVRPFIKGRLLDVGCGFNQLVRSYGNGVGADVYDWGDVDCVVEDSANLPFDNASFDTITILAALNHIPNRQAVLKECYRLLKPDGLLLITMISPGVSRVWHFLRAPWDADQHERGMKCGEVYGIRPAIMQELIVEAGLSLIDIKPFMLGINRLYMAKRYEE